MSKRRETPLEKIFIESHHCTIDLRLEMLSQAPFFKGLDPEMLREVNKRFSATHFEAGEMIYYEDEPALRLRVVVSGKVKLMRHTEEGKDVLIDMLKPGEFFGTLSHLGGEVYSETATSQTHTCILSIDSQAFRDILTQYPVVAVNVLDIMAGRLQASRDSLFELSTLPVDQRIARILYRLAEKFGEQDDEFGLLIQMLLTRKDLADMAATTTETASRIISRLKKDGIIHAGRQWIAIEDLQELETLSA